MVSTDLNGLAPNVPATPTRKENRRRSWFGLVTPKRKERVASLAPPTSSNSRGPSSSVSGSDSIEELEPTPPRTCGSSSRRQQQEWHDTDDDLGADMDSDMEGTVRRKRNPAMRRWDGNGDAPGTTSKDSDSDTPVRMKDTATLAILSRNNTVKPKPPTSRIFSRTASSQSSSSADVAQPAPRPKTFANILTPSKVPARSSSVNARSPRLGQFDTSVASFDGSPVNKHKPLPELPQLESSRHASIAASRAVSLPIPVPAPPTDIVVTPSSPCEKDPFEGLFGLESATPTPSTSYNPAPDVYPSRPASAPVSRNPSTRATSRNVSGNTITQSNQNSLGLGLPDGASGRRPVSAGDTLMPQRQVAVSSPLPGRPPSPSTKVTFSADDKPEHNGGKVAKPRPRSFSAMFTRSQPTEPTTTDEDEPSATKFGWLGVRSKTIRRRRSELKLTKKRSGFLTENERDADNSSHANQHAGQSLNRLANTSSPMLINRSTPDVSQTPHSAASSELSFLPAIEQQTFWSAQDWALRNSSSTEVETPSDVASNGDVKRDTVSYRDGAVPRRMLEPASQRSSMGSNSPLGSLPETGPPPTIAEHGAASTPPRVTPRPAGRGRSFSDAARRTQPEEVSLSSSHSSLRSPLEGDRPVTPSRPEMPSRSSSGGVAVLGKVRSVLFKSRPRSNSALRYGGSADERELGSSGYGSLEQMHPRPASSASTSSFGPSPALPPVRIRPEDVPQVSSLALQAGDDDRHVILCETPERSPRSSYAASFTSSLTTQSQRRSHTADPHSTLATGFHAGRARAQTLSSTQGSLTSVAATAGPHIHVPWHRSSHDAALSPPSSFVATAFLPTPSTPIFPTAATPPRQRSGSIRRLSTGLFRSNPSSPKPPSGQLFPLPARGPGAGSSGHASPALEDPPSRVASPLPLSRSTTPVKGSSADENIAVIQDCDTAEVWLERLAGVSRRELAGILAASSDEFHTAALQLYMKRFDFTHIALDVALRRFLMLMSLPKETQQIDRVIEAFATHYDNCEPGLFGTKDNAYVLAFSMMMLHTDAFNRHNKNKMTKADYVRNTRLDGVPEVVLEAIYDNITFTPFVFIEDDKEAAMAAAGNPPSTIHGHGRSGKIDVYDLIVGGQLGFLRVDVERSIGADSPFSCMGTLQFLDVDRLQRAFAEAHQLQFVTSRPRRKSSATLTTQLSDKSGAAKSTPKEEVTTLKVTKVGLLSRKDDSPTSKRAGARKWRSWSVILTGSQLLFFKDTIWALTLLEQIRHSQKSSRESAPRMTGFQPDEVLSVKDSIAVFDRDYSGPPHTFRLVMPENRHYLLQATDEHQMNDWLTLINYASTFKTASIRMRAAGMNSGDAVRAGAAAAEEHRKDVASGSGTSGSGTPNNGAHVRSVLFSEARPSQQEDQPVATARPKLRRVGSLRSSPAPIVDISGANDVVVNGGEQMEAVIGSVKAELAAGRSGAVRSMSLPQGSDSPNQTLRSSAIQARVASLKEQAATVEKRLTSSLRVARNLAVLTPFQKSTRDRIEAAVPDLAASIRADRLELSKLHLWITMLLKDLDRDQRDWARVRHVALQAATRSLKAPSDRSDRRATIGVSPIEIPKLSLPHDHGHWTEDSMTRLSSSPLTPGELPVTNPMSDDEHEPRHSPTSEPPSERTSGSDYELAPEYISGSSESLRDEMERQLAYSVSPEPGDTPKPTYQAQFQEQLDDGLTPVSTKTELPKNGGDSRDQPEHWRNTRAATKVSLAHMPRSSLGELSRKFIKVEDNVVAGANDHM